MTTETSTRVLPDLGFQFSSVSSGLTPEQYDGLFASLTASLAPGADLRTAAAGSALRLGIWLRPAADPAESAARDAGLIALPLPAAAADETFAAFVHADLIRRSAQIAWYQTPQWRDEQGRPKAEGPIHLSGFTLELAAPDRLVATISGTDERVRPRLHFDLVTTDILWAAGGRLASSARVRLDGNHRNLDRLSKLLDMELPAFGGAWSLQGAVVPAACDSPAGSPGRSVLRLLPAEILIPGGCKIALDYRRLQIGPDGLRAGGAWGLAERRPAVAVLRPSGISAEFPDLTSLTQLRVRTTDLRPPLRQVSWKADGLVANPGARSTPVVFDVRGARPGQVLSKTVAVRVEDSDGLTAEAQITVPVYITWDGLPPHRRPAHSGIRPITLGSAAPAS